MGNQHESAFLAEKVRDPVCGIEVDESAADTRRDAMNEAAAGPRGMPCAT